MASNVVKVVSAFIEGSPPGELADVVNDIKALITEGAEVLEAARPAFRKYNEEQLTAVKLPGNGKTVLVTPYNSLGDDKYYDVESQSSFTFDHLTHQASNVQSHPLDSQHTDLIASLSKTLSAHAREHYPTSTHAVYPTPADSTLALLLTANKYSPANFWNGRFRTLYFYDPATSMLAGTLKCDVHYYEDGNVRLTTSKSLPATRIAPPSAAEVVKAVARVEKAYQEELNRGFGRLCEGEFKSLRRQLPVTRQKVDWEKVGSYRAGKEIGAGRR